MNYFAYGSNMSSTVMSDRCPGVRSRGAALLGGYRLAFTLPSQRWGGCAADIQHCHPCQMWGVLWDVTSADLAVLDSWEANYDRLEIVVTLDSRDVAALTYRAKTHLRSTVPGEPTSDYLNHLRAGAREHGLPKNYIDQLLPGSSVTVPPPTSSPTLLTHLPRQPGEDARGPTHK